LCPHSPAAFTPTAINVRIAGVFHGVEEGLPHRHLAPELLLVVLAASTAARWSRRRRRSAASSRMVEAVNPRCSMAAL